MKKPLKKWSVTVKSENGQKYKKTYVKLDCDKCGSHFTDSIGGYNYRIKNSNSGKLFCSKDCLGEWKSESQSFG